MRLRFVVQDGGDDTAVEGAVDEVAVDAVWVNCQDHTPPAVLSPNPVGDTLHVEIEPGGHTVLTWQAPAGRRRPRRRHVVPCRAGHRTRRIVRRGRFGNRDAMGRRRCAGRGGALLLPGAKQRTTGGSE